MRGRPNLFTSYEEEMRLFPTTTKRVMLVVALVLAVLLPLGQLPGLRFLGDSDWLIIIDRALIFGIAALGLNLLTGVSGQVSLGHSFFMAVGAYTAVVLGADAGRTVWGLGLPMWIWLPAAGIVAAVLGILVAPTAVRVRGLYLAFVTLGLVFIGLHLWRSVEAVAGKPGTGRPWPALELALWKGDPIISFASAGPWFGIELSAQAKSYFFFLFLLIVFALLAKNLMRTRPGRAWAAIRDRDIAAEVMGVNMFRWKTQAFAVSSFYAGVAGALFAAFLGRVIPESWDLLLAVEFIAIILIGGAGTITGTLLGTVFVVLTPRIVEAVTFWMAEELANQGTFAWLADLFIRKSPDDLLGFVSTDAAGPGLSIFQLNVVLFGVLIIVFLIAEPLGLYGIWIRVRNYWKGWPFTY
ncbi:MAG TPA: branched-chain amino acid ABC transporter permease [Actinobacteria bacterium]|nr:branched-chain amino acid ABC transporter permease [Actinomycetota bacterium]